MEKLHCMVKYFSSAIINRKDYDLVLENHRYLPTNQLEKDHNGTRIVDVCELSKSALEMKTGTFAY